MSATLQTIIALAVVALAGGWLLYSAFSKKSSSGCGGGGCSAVSPEVKKLRAKLKR
ncbi:MAG: FeoB-associated Cys-rich membrane protein [Lacunisphaera sp.]